MQGGSPMLIDASATQAISYLGWVDLGAFWVYSAKSESCRHVEIPGAQNISLLDGSENFFGVTWQPSATEFCVAAYPHDAVEKATCTVRVNFDKPSYLRPTAERLIVRAEVEGDASALRFLPKAFLVRGVQLRLALMTADPHYLEIRDLPWFRDQYDSTYQTLLDVREVPHSELLVFCVQRDSRLLVYEAREQSVVKMVDLAGRNGNPALSLRLKFHQLWASDYDTLVCVEMGTWSATRSVNLQPRSPDEIAKFIGLHGFTRDEKFCFVARPFSGDVVVIDPNTLAIVEAVRTGNQPFDSTILLGDRLVARDWKTGRLLTGSVSRIVG